MSLRLLPRLPQRCLPVSTSSRLPLLRRATTNHAPHHHHLLLRATFATSQPARATILLNPRRDENGREMMIEVTPRAAQRLKEIQAKDNNPNLALRITVESGGCHGFQYMMSLSDQVDTEEDTVFVEGDAKVVMDEPSLELLKGSKVDYTMELIGSQFKIVDNPKATSSCGCGTSFDIKI